VHRKGSSLPSRKRRDPRGPVFVPPDAVHGNARSGHGCAESRVERCRPGDDYAAVRRARRGLDHDVVSGTPRARRVGAPGLARDAASPDLPAPECSPQFWVDPTPPGPAAIASTDYPAGEWSKTASEAGKFTLTAPGVTDLVRLRAGSEPAAERRPRHLKWRQSPSPRPPTGRTRCSCSRGTSPGTADRWWSTSSSLVGRRHHPGHWRDPGGQDRSDRGRAAGDHRRHLPVAPRRRRRVDRHPDHRCDPGLRRRHRHLAAGPLKRISRS